MKSSFVELEASLSLLDARLDQLRGIVSEFPEEKLWERPESGVSSLGNIVCHVAGSMRDWIENGLGGGSWVRDRDFEFQRDGGMDAAGLIEHLNKTREHCEKFLVGVDGTRWNEERPFRNRQFTVRQIVLQQISHAAYHTGQAAFLRRIVGGLEPAA